MIKLFDAMGRALRRVGRWLPALVAVASAPALAQTYPTRPIRVLVPFAAGGGLDFVARIAAQKLAAGLRQTVVVDNRPGAGGNIGTDIVAKASPDGYTLLIVSNSFAMNPSLYRIVPYDPVRDFAPVSMLTSYMMFLVVHPSQPMRTVKAIVEVAKAKPGYLNYASAGVGTTTHIAGELFAYLTGVRLTHVPYKGTAPSLPAVMSGEASMSFGSAAAVPHVRTGRLALVAVTGAKRSSAFPDAPTVAESGVPGYEATGWNALFAPAGTPAAIVARLSEVIGKGLSETDAMSAFDKQQLEQSAGSPEALGAIVRAETAKWPKIFKAAGIEPQ